MSSCRRFGWGVHPYTPHTKKGESHQLRVSGTVVEGSGHAPYINISNPPIKKRGIHSILNPSSSVIHSIDFFSEGSPSWPHGLLRHHRFDDIAQVPGHMAYFDTIVSMTSRKSPCLGWEPAGGATISEPTLVDQSDESRTKLPVEIE